MTYITSFERISFKKGIEKGIEKGELNKSKKVALNLIKMKLPFEQIAQATELPIETIQEMAKSN